jgi:hypothetical protein
LLSLEEACISTCSACNSFITNFFHLELLLV